MPGQKRRSAAVAAIAAGVVLAVTAGFAVWFFGQERLWWGHSQQVQRLWDEPVMAEIQAVYGEQIVDRVSPQTGVGRKPTPASVSVLVEEQEDQSSFQEFIQTASEQHGWQNLGTCPENISYCATKGTTLEETLVLTYQRQQIGDQTAGSTVEKVTISVQ